MQLHMHAVLHVLLPYLHTVALIVPRYWVVGLIYVVPCPQQSFLVQETVVWEDVDMGIYQWVSQFWRKSRPSSCSHPLSSHVVIQSQMIIRTVPLSQPGQSSPLTQTHCIAASSTSATSQPETCLLCLNMRTPYTCLGHTWPNFTLIWWLKRLRSPKYPAIKIPFRRWMPGSTPEQPSDTMVFCGIY
jgi:hypothetical protein